MWQRALQDVPIISIAQIADVPKDAILLLAYNADYLAQEAVKAANKAGVRYDALSQIVPVARFYHLHKNVYDTLMGEYYDHPKPHFYASDFENIMQAIMLTQHLHGDIVEIGTFQGSSARAICHFLKQSQIHKKAYFIDTFEGFTYAQAKDSKDARWADTHTQTSLEAVQTYLSAYTHFECVKQNIITDALPASIQSICVANIDVDMYEAIKAALSKVADKIVKNGIIIVEDYGHSPALIGAQVALEEFLQTYREQFMPLYMGLSGQMFLIRI